MTAVDIQDLEIVNDAVARATGGRVHETVPDTCLHQTDDVIDVGRHVKELRNRLRERGSSGLKLSRRYELLLEAHLPCWPMLRCAPALTRSADKGRELSRTRRSRTAADSPLRDGLYEFDRTCWTARLRTGARIVGRLGSRWYAVCAETPREGADRTNPPDADALRRSSNWRRRFGATVRPESLRTTGRRLIVLARARGCDTRHLRANGTNRWKVLLRRWTLDKRQQERRRTPAIAWSCVMPG